MFVIYDVLMSLDGRFAMLHADLIKICLVQVSAPSNYAACDAEHRQFSARLGQ